MGDRLRIGRETTELGQVNFARESDISLQTVGDCGLGITKPKTLVLKAWAVRTGVPLEWVITGATGPSGDDGGATGRPRQGSNLRPSD